MAKQIRLNKNIVLIGMPGSGKTTLGKIAAKRLGVPFCDIDKLIERREGKTIPEIFEKGEDYFRRVETDAIEEAVGKIPQIISTGGGVVKKEYNMELLHKNSVVIFINRPPEEIVKNINVARRPLLASGPSRIYELYQERYALYKKYCDMEILNNMGLYNAVNKIIVIWKKYNEK